MCVSSSVFWGYLGLFKLGFSCTKGFCEICWVFGHRETSSLRFGEAMKLITVLCQNVRGYARLCVGELWLWVQISQWTKSSLFSDPYGNWTSHDLDLLWILPGILVTWSPLVELMIHSDTGGRGGSRFGPQGMRISLICLLQRWNDPAVCGQEPPLASRCSFHSGSTPFWEGYICGLRHWLYVESWIKKVLFSMGHWRLRAPKELGALPSKPGSVNPLCHHSASFLLPFLISQMSGLD